MRKISVFNHVTVDGFFAGPNGETDWFKVIRKDDAYDKWTHGQAKSGSTLMFGRTTYEMMKSYWPTAEAIRNDPGMAEVLNNSPKIVFSRTLQRVEEAPNWKNIQLLHQIDREEIRRLKETREITILGSGSIVQQLSDAGLIDEYHLVMVPIVLGSGKSLFKDVRTNLNLVEARPFQNGLVVLHYSRA